jgi:hypothetical protein
LLHGRNHDTKANNLRDLHMPRIVEQTEQLHSMPGWWMQAREMLRVDYDYANKNNHPHNLRYVHLRIDFGEGSGKDLHCLSQWWVQQ